MHRAGFEAGDAVALLGELARLTAPPAGEEEICDQGLAILGKGLGAERGAVFLRVAPESVLHLAARKGEVSEQDLRTAALRALEVRDVIEEQGPVRAPSRISLPIGRLVDPLGAVVLLGVSTWDPPARQFAHGALGILAASLRTSRTLEGNRQQGELLARRNAELEVLRELAGALQEPRSEEETLQAALDLVLKRLGLEAGWIFWGESTRGELGLVACRGIAEDFVRRAREGGIGDCLCKDVFRTGKLRFARNTTECPRLPHLLPGREPMTHACIPLKFERGTLGVLNIANRPGRLFTPQELQFLETVGNQVCLAVNRARMARAESRKNAEARALASLARAIGGSLEEERVLAAVGEYARDLLKADRCALFIGDAPSNLVVAYLSGPALPGLGVGLPADLEALGFRALADALRERKPLVIPGEAKGPRENRELFRRWDIGSAILIPLIAHERLRGAMLATRSGSSAWSDEEVELTDALARQASVAIENARLYRDAQSALLRLQQAQEAMLKAERLAAVGTLASSLAHEVRNPLNSINLQLVLLSRRAAKLGEPPREEIGSLIETARREIARLDSLVEEFLSLSTIDRISLAQVRPEDVFHEVLTLMEPAARDRGIVLSEEFHGSSPGIPMDREKIKQVLINLVRNAVEAMPKGGKLTLAIRSDDSAVAMDVADTGPGIEPGVDVFDFFVTTKHGGTGLGLPIARRIVEAHAGSLTYRSEPGRGTTFTVLLKTR